MAVKTYQWFCSTTCRPVDLLVHLTLVEIYHYWKVYIVSLYKCPYNYVGQGTASFIDLPTGNVVANFEGAVNTTLMCNVTGAGGIQVQSTWSVGNFRGVSGLQLVGIADPQHDIFLITGDPIPGFDAIFNNRIMILNWTALLDRVDLFCGTGTDRDQAGVTLRIYSKFFYYR